MHNSILLYIIALAAIPFSLASLQSRGTLAYNYALARRHANAYPDAHPELADYFDNGNSYLSRREPLNTFDELYSALYARDGEEEEAKVQNPNNKIPNSPTFGGGHGRAISLQAQEAQEEKERQKKEGQKKSWLSRIKGRK